MQNQIRTKPLLLALILSSLIAGVCMLISLPDWLFYFRPDWLALVVIYWIVKLPERVSIGYACINGLFLDLLLVKPFGVNAIAFVLVGYLAAKWSAQIRVLSLWQQCLFVSVLIMLLKLIVGMTSAIMADFVFTTYYWFSAVGNVVFWAVISILLRDMKRVLMSRKVKQ